MITKYEYNEFRYLIKQLPEEKNYELSIDHNRDIPEYLFKYYSLNSYSVDCLINGYLYSSHPHQLNDKYDCSPELIDFSNCDLNFFINKLNKSIHVFDEEFIRYKFLNGRWELERAVSKIERNRLFMKFGIISLTENKKDILMWAYYSLNSGFGVNFLTDLLNKKWHGPFPINYVGA